MEVMSLKSFIGGIHPKDQKQYTKDLPIIKIKASDEVICGSSGLKHKELSPLVSMRFFKEMTAPLHSFVKILAL